MNYRQWKKNYKKRHGVNPPASIDKRKRRKAVARATKALAKVDFMESIGRAAETLTGVMANFMRALGNGMDAAGTVCRNAADYMQPLEIKGNVLSWEVKPVVCDYGVYENNALNGSSVLKLITNSRRAAEKIVEIMQQDNLEHVRLNQPERIQKKAEPLDYTRPPENVRARFYRDELREIQKKLQRAGIETRQVFWSEKERRSYYWKNGAPERCKNPDCKNCPFPPCRKGEANNE